MPSFIGSIPTTDDSDMKLVHDIVSKKIRIDKSKDNTINRIRCILDKEEIFFLIVEGKLYIWHYKH